jgi:hypothetical protein
LEREHHIPLDRQLQVVNARRERSRAPAPAAVPGSPIPVLHALTDGLLALKFLIPELISDNIMISAFEAMAGSDSA